jgi:hypothetical protein
MSIGSEDTGWFVAGVSTVVASLSGTIAVLFKLNESKNAVAIEKLETRVVELALQCKDSDKRHDDCQLDRARLSVEVAVIREHLAAHVESALPDPEA